MLEKAAFLMARSLDRAKFWHSGLTMLIDQDRVSIRVDHGKARRASIAAGFLGDVHPHIFQRLFDLAYICELILFIWQIDPTLD